MACTKEDIIKSLEEMKLMELNELVKAIEEHFGVTAAAAAPVAVAAAADENAGPSEVNLILADAGASKVKVIKAIAAHTGKGLMDAKKMIATLPATLLEKAKPEAAEEFKSLLVEAGATVEIK